MSRLFTIALLVALAAAGLLWSTVVEARDRIAGIPVYKKHQTPRRVTHHPAYPLKAGGDRWLFDRTRRRAQHGEFVRYSREKLPLYAGQRIDCADVALDNLLNFARDRGLRMTFKVWKNGWRYVDSASFRSFDQLKRFARQYLGAHNVTDNCKLIKPLARLSTPDAWERHVKPGDLLMWSYNKPSRRDPALPGRPTTVGHTQPIMEVVKGRSLSGTRLKVMNGDIQLSTGEALAARASWETVSRIKPVSGGASLSNYPSYNGRLFHVLQKYNWHSPTGPSDPAQPSQGPLRWRIMD